MDRKELKNLAKQQIKGNVGILFVITLLMSLVSMAASFVPVVGSFIVTPALTIGMVIVYLKMTEGEDPAIGTLFSGFNCFWSAFKVTFFNTLFIMLWSILFVIPGIIKAISYSQAMYIMAECDGNMRALEAIDESKKMMNGHKMEYFVLILSFIGWILVGCITFGIAFIWILPYMNATMANFYNSIKPKAEPVYSADYATV